MFRMPVSLGLAVLLSPTFLSAQQIPEEEGIVLGSVHIRPVATVLGAYDNRIQYSELDGAIDDFYTEVMGTLYLNNLPARYNLSGHARYGYRFYSDFSDQNNDFYSARIALDTHQNPLFWGLSADVNKTLNYNTAYDPSSGEGPDSILSDQPNRRWVANGHIGYEAKVSDKTAITPAYNIQHYLQEFEDGGTAEWQIHEANIQVGHDYSSKTRLFTGAYYSLQANDDEDGYVGTVEVGAESQTTEKTKWIASVGLAAADYDLSGSDQSGVFNVRIHWQPSDQVSTYIFGGNQYQPGFDGGAARLVYRMGYGADWEFAPRWILGGNVLHDYQQELGSVDDSTYGGVRHFINAFVGYDLTKKTSLALSGRYVNDEIEEDQTIISLRADYRY